MRRANVSDSTSATSSTPTTCRRQTRRCAALLAGEIQDYRAERRYLRKDSGWLWGLAAVSLLRDENTDEPIYVVVQITDIDRQKRAEEALGVSEARWKYAVESAGQGVWDANLRNGSDKVYYSRMWRVMRGFAPDEEVDSSIESWMQRVHPDDRERIRNIVLQQNSGELPRNAFEYRERHRDGHYIWVLSRGGPVEWEADGKPARFVGTDTDISTLKAVETALAVEKEKLRVTLQSIGDGVISTDADANVTFMNPIAEQMTGWTSSEAIGRKVEEVFVIVDDATGDTVPDPVRQALDRQGLYYLDEDAVLVGRQGDRRAVARFRRAGAHAAGRIAGRGAGVPGHHPRAGRCRRNSPTPPCMTG